MANVTIYLDQEAALDAASKYNKEAEAFQDQESRVSDMESDLSEFEGDAATAAKDTLERMQLCMNELASCILVHSGMIQSAVGSFVDTDQSAASSIAVVK